MIEMHFPVSKLLETLKKNRAAHATNAEKMKTNYKEALKSICEEKIADLAAGKKVNTMIDLQEPFDYLNSYDDVIGMLEMTTEDTIKLNNDQFRCYARDSWPNKRNFESVSASYMDTLSKRR